MRGGWRLAALVALMAFIAMALRAPLAEASLGYEPDSSKPVIALPGKSPLGIAVDQESQRIYVAMPFGAGEEPGFLNQLEPGGTPTAASPFTAGSTPVFVGVAVDPSSASPHSVYVAEAVGSLPQGTFGATRIVPFSSSGVMGTPFATENPANVTPQIAVGSSGRIFYPSIAAAAVKVYNSSGVVQETILCGGCPGGAFSQPIAVALDSADNLYVVDRANGRVLKFTHAGGPYVYAAQFQAGRNAVAVAVDASSGSVLVGDNPGGGNYHVVAYDSSGVQFDDFGAGIFEETFPPLDPQLAVNATTHKVYVGDVKGNSLRVFSLVAIQPPATTTEPASAIGQVSATLNSKVNANLHATSDCHFEYADDAFFDAHAFVGSTQRACPSLPDGLGSTPESVAIDSLEPATTYHFRVVATSNGGTTSGAALEFTTLPETPATVTTEPAASIGTTATTLKGKVNPHGGTVSSCRFEYGSTASYGKSAPCPTAVGSVGTDVVESFRVTGLAPATAYHYRLTVTTNAGTVSGGDVQFTTLALPPEEPAPEGPTTGGGSGGQLPPTTVLPVTPQKKPLTCRRGFRKKRVRGKLRCVKKHRRRAQHRRSAQ